MANLKPTITVDAKNMACPGPISALAKVYRKAQNGDMIEILATDPGFRPDIKAWTERTSNQLLELNEDGKIIKALVKIVGKKM